MASDDKISSLEQVLINIIRDGQAESRAAHRRTLQVFGAVALVLAALIGWQIAMLGDLAGANPQAAAEATRTVLDAVTP